MSKLTFSFSPNHGVLPLSIHFEGSLTGNSNTPISQATIVLQGFYNAQWSPMGITPKTDIAGKYSADTSLTVENGWVPGTIEQLQAVFQGDTTNAAIISAPKTVTIDPAPTYDSDWINLSNKQGQYVTISHNLNSTNLITDINGRTTSNGNIHQKYLGLIGYIPGWKKIYGGLHNYGEATSIVKTKDGGYAIASSKSSSVSGNFDAYLVKTDPTGNVLWEKTYGGPKSDYGRSLVTTSDGGYAIAGHAYDLGNGGFGIYLVKTDSLGNQVWQKTYGGTKDDYGYCVTQTSDGGYAITGTTQSFGSGGENIFLLKTDSQGNQLWLKTYASGSGFSVIQTTDGGYAIAGRIYSSVGPAGYLVKTDSQGNQLWQKTYGGTYEDCGRCVIQTSDAGYAITGTTSSFGAGSYDVYLVKTDSQGNQLWQKTYGGTEADGGESVVQTSDGGYAIAGYTSSFGNRACNIYLVKTDSVGNLLWQKTYGETKATGHSIVQTSDDGFAIAGSTNSSEPGKFDVYLVKTADHGEFGLAKTDSTANTLTLYRGANDVYWNFVRVRIWKIP